MNNKVYNLVLAVLTIVIIILLLDRCNLKKTIETNQNLYNALGDTLVVYKNKDGSSTAKIALLETEKLNQFLSIQSRDSVIVWLQEEVERNKKRLGNAGSSVTVIGNKTGISETVKTEIIGHDTLYAGDTVYVFPKYSAIVEKKGEFNGAPISWVDARVRSNKDSSTLDLIIRNQYSIVVGKEKGLRGKSFAEVTSYNPYTEIQVMRTYSVKTPAEKKFGLGVSVGYGAYFDPAKIRFGSGVTASLSLNYNIIEFK